MSWTAEEYNRAKPKRRLPGSGFDAVFASVMASLVLVMWLVLR